MIPKENNFTMNSEELKSQTFETVGCGFENTIDLKKEDKSKSVNSFGIQVPNTLAANHEVNNNSGSNSHGFIQSVRSDAYEKIENENDDQNFGPLDLTTKHMNLPSEIIPNKCSFCQKSFRSKLHLMYHLKTHAMEDRIECNVCHKYLSNRTNLSRHNKIHTGEKPFVCDTCYKAFSNKTTLKRHMRTHTGEKPFVCGFCRKPFSRKSNLSIHLRLHTGEKPFQCIFCKQLFHTKSNLTYHLRTHTGEKPFKCNFCNKSFRIKSHMSYHMKTHGR